MNGSGFECGCCGRWFDGLPDIAYTRPDSWDETAAARSPEANQADDELCIVDGEHFHIRCVLLVPIRGTSQSFGWGVWVGQSEADFDLYAQAIDALAIELMPAAAIPARATAGVLANRLLGYPDTLGLKLKVRWQPDGARPLVEVAPCAHPLFRDQTEGITAARALAFAQLTHRPVLV